MPLREKNICTEHSQHFSSSRPNIGEWLSPLGNEDTIDESPAGVCILGGP